MEEHINSYKLEQDNKVFIFSTSIIGNSVRLSCESSDGKKFKRDFTIEQLKQINEIFNFVKEPNDATKFIDETLRNQKVGVVNEIDNIKIVFYISTNGNTNMIELSLREPNTQIFDSSYKSNDFLQQANFQNSQLKNIMENPNVPKDEIEAILNASYGEPSPEEKELNKYFENIETNANNTNSYNTNINQYMPNTNSDENNNNFQLNEFLEMNNKNIIESINKAGTSSIMNTFENSTNEYNQSLNNQLNSPIINNPQIENQFKPPTIGPVNNNINQIVHSPYLEGTEEQKPIIYPLSPIMQNNNNPQLDFNQNILSSPIISPSRQKEQKIEDNNDFNEEIKKLLDLKNINNNDELTSEIKNNNNQLTPRVTTNVLPVQTTTKILPPIGLNSINDLNSALEKINSQKHNNIPFQDFQTYEFDINEDKIMQSLMSPQVQNNLMTKQKEINVNKFVNVNQDINKANNNINNANNFIGNITPKKPNNEEEIFILRKENLELKRQLAECRKNQNNSEEVIILRNKIAELEPLKKKIAEMEVLRGQLTELNALRAQVAEFNAIKGQLKEMNHLRSKLDQMNSLKSQISELNKYKIKAAEVDKLKLKIEELEKIKNNYEEQIKDYKAKLMSNKPKQNITKIKETQKEDEDEDEDEESETVKGDIIHDGNELELLIKKINKNNNKLTLNLLYKATADSDKAAAFHAKCDEAKSSIVLVETDKGKRFGGFTSCDWTGDCIDKKDENAFVFSLDKMKTYNNIPGENAIGCYPSYGPIFLGCQIRIYDDAFTKGGTTFEAGLNFETEEDFELTGGDRVFKVKEIEVYEVIEEE
jgi:hypothetical protein